MKALQPHSEKGNHIPYLWYTAQLQDSFGCLGQSGRNNPESDILPSPSLALTPSPSLPLIAIGTDGKLLPTRSRGTLITFSSSR
ncbi:MAG TPA: hypothetical protein V6C90_19375 [Coleofasciculaceae cyanobacterium]